MSGMLDYRDEKTYTQTRRPVSLASTLIPDAYRSPEFYRLEQERLWRKSWLCVGYKQQLAQVGDTILTRVDDQSIIVTRSSKDKISAFYNVCRHRGAELISESGSYSMFRCPYHAWGYELNGTLKGTPYFKDDEPLIALKKTAFDMSSVKQFDKADYGLLPVRVATWGCFVFINLDPDCAPLEQQLGDLPERARRYPFEDLVLTKTGMYEVKANWKLVGENFMEYYHLPWVHPALNRVSHVNNHFPFQGEGWYYGMTTSPLDKDPTVPIDRELKRIPGLDEEEQQAARWYWLFPNVALSLLPEHIISMIVMPGGHDFTRERFDFFFHPETMKSSHFEQGAAELYKFWDEVNREDISIVESVQRGLSNQAYGGGRMCFRFEDSIHRFQNNVIDKMVGAPPRSAGATAAPAREA